MQPTAFLTLTALKATIVLAAAFLGAAALRRASASARYFLWISALAAVLAIPILSTSLRPWSVSISAPHAAIVSFYLGLGWLTILPLPLYYRAVGWRAMNYVWIGAALYSLGAICELTRWPIIVPGWFQYHEVLHICDTTASVTFFLFVVRYVIPYQPQTQAAPEALAAA